LPSAHRVAPPTDLMASEAKPTAAASERETPGGAVIAQGWPSALLGISYGLAAIPRRNPDVQDRGAAKTLGD
jgi:hypothetical protein